MRVLLVDTALSTAIATVIAATIAALAAWATQRSAAQAAVRNQSVASRTDIEKEAFERAKTFYTDTIDRQANEVRELETDVVELKAKVKELETELASQGRDHETERQRNETERAEQRNETERLRAQLAVAQQTLRLRYPDE